MVFLLGFFGESKSNFKLPPILIDQNHNENFESKEQLKKNQIIYEEIQNLQQIAVNFGKKLEQEEETKVT